MENQVTMGQDRNDTKGGGRLELKENMVSRMESEPVLD